MSKQRSGSRFVQAAVAFALAVSLAACAGWVPGRQSYWDAKVKEMCEKDGGVTIYEHLRITPEDIALLGNIDGKISIPSKASAHPNAPAYSELKLTYLRKEASPIVWRAESVIWRRSDEKVIGRWVVYTRVGGDLPGLAHESSFSCPDMELVIADLQRLFIVEGGSK